MNTITGSSAFLSLLEDEGITHMFGNPGTTELPIMDALGRHPDLTYILGLQESIVIAMADGYGRASGRLTSCNVHVAPGLGNAMGSIYNAAYTGTPMIVTAGQQEQGHGVTEPILYAPLVPIAEPVVKWATEITRLEDMPRIVRRAAKVALTPPTGPVFISLPGDVLNDQAGVELGTRTRIDAASRPSDVALDALATRLLAAERPAIIAGPEVVTSDALAEVADLASALGAAAFQQTIPYGSFFPSEHKAYMGALSRIQRQVRDALSPYDLLIFIGADVLRMSVWSEIDPMPPGIPAIQIGLDDWEMGKNYPAEIAVRGDVQVTLAALLPLIASKGGGAKAAAAEKRLAALSETNWTAKRAVVRSAAEARAAETPIAADWLMAQVVDSLPADAIVVNEALTSGARLLDMLPYRDRYDYHGNASGGIGWAIAGAVGISLAQPGRPVVALIGDGSAMYSIQALWTAAHLDLPITYVITNNQGYRIIKQRLLAFHGNDKFIGMDFTDPEIDFCGLAQSFGVAAERIADPAAIRPALEAAIKSGKPAMLDVMVERGVG